jgi:hypothetical protein
MWMDELRENGRAAWTEREARVNARRAIVFPEVDGEPPMGGHDG